MELGHLCSPCGCKGSQGFVHVRCLKSWVERAATTSSVRFGSCLRCPTCKERYRDKDLLLLLAASQALSMQLDLPQTVALRLATELQSRNMAEEARAVLRREVRRWAAIVAEADHPDTLHGLMAVADAMLVLRQYACAATLLRRVLKSCERRLPVELELDFAEERQAPLSALLAERRALACEAATTLVEALRAQGREEEATQVMERLQRFQRRGWRDWLRVTLLDPTGLERDWHESWLHKHLDSFRRYCVHSRLPRTAFVLAISLFLGGPLLAREEGPAGLARGLHMCGARVALLAVPRAIGRCLGKTDMVLAVGAGVGMGLAVVREAFAERPPGDAALGAQMG